MRQYQWRRLMTVAVIASLLLGLAATGLGIEALRKINNIKATEAAVSIITPVSGATISGVVGLGAKPIGPNVTAADFLATGGPYHDVKIGTGNRSVVGWVAVGKLRACQTVPMRSAASGTTLLGTVAVVQVSPSKWRTRSRFVPRHFDEFAVEFASRPHTDACFRGLYFAAVRAALGSQTSSSSQKRSVRFAPGPPPGRSFVPLSTT